MSSPTRDPHFPDTRWSVFQRIREAPSEIRLRALDELCRIYWPAVYSFARFRGHSPSDAEDLTQGFFAMLLDLGSFESIKPDTGKLRSWLIRSFENYRRSEHRAAQAQRRGGGWIQVEITGETGEEWWQQFGITPDTDDPARLLDRIWALTLLERALEEVGRDYAARGHLDRFRALRPHAEFNGQEAPYAEIAEQLEMTPEAARKAVQRLRIAYAKAIRSQIEQTVEGAEAIDTEFAELRAALR